MFSKTISESRPCNKKGKNREEEDEGSDEGEEVEIEIIIFPEENYNNYILMKCFGDCGNGTSTPTNFSNEYLNFAPKLSAQHKRQTPSEGL